jgi:cysteine desulfurase / selenocysteine lyase
MRAVAGSAKERYLSKPRLRFPALGRLAPSGRPLVYLDSAATSLRPEEVIDAGCHFCRMHDGNPHRGLHMLSQEATEVLEETRQKVARWIGAPGAESVVFTRNATAALNLVARGLERSLKPGNEILLTEMEHHANLVPWLTLAKFKGLKLRYIPIDDNGELVLDALTELIGPQTRVVSVTHVSNVLGTINPVRDIARAAHRAGALMVVDAAQSVGHMPVRFDDLGADLLAFSAHKCYGPTGLGVLVGKPEVLERLDPLETGGDMIEYVSYEEATWAPVPHRFEAGTPNVAAAAAFSKAIDFMEGFGLEAIEQHGRLVTSYALERLSTVPGLRVLGPKDPGHRGALVSFVDPEVHPHDLATLLDQNGIAVRAGHHCAQPLHRRLGLFASTRASFGIYSEPADIDALVDGIIEARKVFLR